MLKEKYNFAIRFITNKEIEILENVEYLNILNVTPNLLFFNEIEEVNKYIKDNDLKLYKPEL